jgi:hypothetical protein
MTDTVCFWWIAPPLLGSVVEAVPGVFFGLPLIALASFVFAATHHENGGQIQLATIQWIVWMVGVLGVVLAVVLLLGWL